MTKIIGDYRINSIADVETIPTAELLIIFNKLRNRTTTKFASRKMGVEQTYKAIMELAPNVVEESKPAPKKDIDPKLSAIQKKAEKLRKHGAGGRYVSTKGLKKSA